MVRHKPANGSGVRTKPNRWVVRPVVRNRYRPLPLKYLNLPSFRSELRRARLRLATLIAPEHAYVADDLEFHLAAERFRESWRRGQREGRKG